MIESVIAERLSSLGAPVRLRMIRALVRAGDEGLTVGELQRKLGLAASTHAHHLAALVNSGLVLQQRIGREVICTAAFQTLRAVGAYLTDQCCLDVETKRETAAA